MNLNNAYSNVIMWKYLRKLLRPSPPVGSIKRFNVAPSREVSRSGRFMGLKNDGFTTGQLEIQKHAKYGLYPADIKMHLEPAFDTELWGRRIFL